jgi:hypothetical protein
MLEQVLFNFNIKNFIATEISNLYQQIAKHGVFGIEHGRKHLSIKLKLNLYIITFRNVYIQQLNVTRGQRRRREKKRPDHCSTSRLIDSVSEGCLFRSI